MITLAFTNTNSIKRSSQMKPFIIDTTEGRLYQLARTYTQALALFTQNIGWTRANLILLSIAEKNDV
jgi:hypothetical protein